MKLYGSAQVEEIPWPATTEGAYARLYLEPMLRHGTPSFIANVHADLFVLIIDEICLPVAVPQKGRRNCYVCCPESHYITYSMYEINILESRILKALLRPVIKAAALLMKACAMSNVVYLNNWFLSTNLYPQLSKDQLDRARNLLRQEFPRRVILLRSLNRYTNAQMLDDLAQLGFQRILSRQLYITDPKKPHYRHKRDFKSDRKHLARTEYRLVDDGGLHAQDYAQIVKLYNDLYLQKYTHLNPQFTQTFIQWAHENGLLQLSGFRFRSELAAIMGFFHRNGVMTTPLFGYDTTKPQRAGLYRLLSSQLVQESERLGCILNQSSGAAKFKMTRGCEPHLEYTVFDSKKAPLRQRWGWWILSFIVNGIGEPLLKRYQL